MSRPIEKIIEKGLFASRWLVSSSEVSLAELARDFTI